MKRFGFVFLGICLISSPSWADYLVIRINLNASTEKAASIGGDDNNAGGPSAGGGAPLSPGAGGSRGGRGGPDDYSGSAPLSLQVDALGRLQGRPHRLRDHPRGGVKQFVQPVQLRGDPGVDPGVGQDRRRPWSCRQLS